MECAAVLVLSPEGTNVSTVLSETASLQLSATPSVGEHPVTIYVDTLFAELFGAEQDTEAGEAGVEVDATETAVIGDDGRRYTKEDHRQTLVSIVPPTGLAANWAVSFIEWTSGSTGNPKAMAVTSWRLSHWIRWRQFHFPMAQLGRSVGMGLFWAWYWHIPLCQGGEVVVVPSGAFHALLLLSVTHLLSTPSDVPFFTCCIRLGAHTHIVGVQTSL